MTATRITSLITFIAGSAGLVMLSSGEPIIVPIAGAALVVGSAILFSRHFWRESDRKRKQESAAHTSLLRSEVDKLTESHLRPHTDQLNNLSLRVDGFSRGILEYVAQLELDVKELEERLESSERQVVKHRDDILSQLSGVIGVYATLRPKVPYPPFGGWAISGDCAQRLLSLILVRRPTRIIEAGSGLSTLLAAQALELIGGEGHVISLEHEKKWLDISVSMLVEHGVSHRATVMHAPLVDTKIGDELFRWYDLTGVSLPDQAEIIFVDGPPKATGPLARYPALPLLFEHLRSDGVLLMDDATRPEERAAVERWNEEFPGIEITVHGDTKGSVEIHKARV